MNEQTIKKIIQGSRILLPFIYGGFYDWVIMLMAVIWGISLLSIANCSKKIIFPEKKICVVMVVIIASYLGTVFYGIDVGMSEIGMFRVISVIEFAILLKYINFEERIKLLKQISEIGSCMGNYYFWKENSHSKQRCEQDAEMDKQQYKICDSFCRKSKSTEGR